ncbi:MAG: peptide deformylase [Arcobacteraceae bacterium]|jgi:peptide deformylase
MVREILTYPTQPSNEYGTDIRVFNDELFALLEDLKDTIIANNVNALAAFQIGSYYNIIVIKNDDNSMIELINPRLISTKDKITTIETTYYFPNLSAEVTRHKNISIVYQDRNAQNNYLRADGDMSVLIQRKLDYNYGATFLSKLTKQERIIFEKKLEFGSDIIISETCPTIFKRDYIMKLLRGLILVMFLIIILALFVNDELILANIWDLQLGISLLASLINIIYFFYAHHEAIKYTSCVSCQSGNIIGTTLISFLKIVVLIIISYFII